MKEAVLMLGRMRRGFPEKRRRSQRRRSAVSVLVSSGYLAVVVSVAMVSAIVAVVASMGFGTGAVAIFVVIVIAMIPVCVMVVIVTVLVVSGPMITAIVVLTAVVSSAGADEAVMAPSVSVAPVGPRADTEEDAVVEVAGPVIAGRSTPVRSVAVVTVGANRRAAANVDAEADLSMTRRRKAHGREESGGTK